MDKPLLVLDPSFLGAVNVDVLPDVASTRSLGSALLPWLYAYAGRFYLGSYFLSTLVDNDKVSDSDKWDGYQFADYLDQAVKIASSPTLAALFLSASDVKLSKLGTSA